MQLKDNFQLFSYPEDIFLNAFESLTTKAMWPGRWEKQQDLTSEDQNVSPKSSTSNYLFDVA